MSLGVVLCLLALAAALLSLVACAALPIAGGAGTQIVDDAGRTVTVKANPSKIISLAPSNTEMLFALGLGDKVVGVTEFDDYPPEAKSKAKIGGFSDVDSEKVVALSPDLILASSLHVGKVVPALEKLGLTVVVVDPKSADDIGARLVTIGRLTGKEREAQDLKSKLDQRMAATSQMAKAAGDKPRVFFMLGDGLFTAGPGSFVDDLITKAGGVNIAADAKSQWPELSMEVVLKADPQVIVIPGPDGKALADKLKSDPAWQTVSAVKAGRFVFLPDQNVVLRPGPRVVDGLDLLAKGLHPS
jgi:iron complex transport system substrate-binding protein